MKLSSYAFNNYGSDAELYNGIHDLETQLAFYERRHTEMQGICNRELEKRREAEAQLAEAREPSKCGAGRTWMVVGPDGIAEILNEAYAQGKSGAMLRDRQADFIEIRDSIRARADKENPR